MPEFCRHKRFIERCPICSQELAEASAPAVADRTRRGSGARRPAAGSGARRAAVGGQRRAGLRVYADGTPRERDDGYASGLVPGLHASEDARRLAHELAFSQTRLAILAGAPGGAYAHARELAREGEIERATTLCFLLAYLAPVEGDEPFAAIELAFAAIDGVAGDAPELDTLPLGPRTSHTPGDGARTLEAYEAWYARSGSQAAAFGGDPEWSADRRFARVFERLALRGLSRAARFEMLVTLGSLGIYALKADSLHFSAALNVAAPRTEGAGDQVLIAAKRVFGIGDPVTLERRAVALTEACGISLDSLDLALSNWAGRERATLGCAEIATDLALESAAAAALGL